MAGPVIQASGRLEFEDACWTVRPLLWSNYLPNCPQMASEMVAGDYWLKTLSLPLASGTKQCRVPTCRPNSFTSWNPQLLEKLVKFHCLFTFCNITTILFTKNWDFSFLDPIWRFWPQKLRLFLFEFMNIFLILHQCGRWIRKLNYTHFPFIIFSLLFSALYQCVENNCET